ncbi:MAG: S1/P1 nuclease [Pyrinomonadaceae bacterium]|nr:S1/P1 nuclease [Pyrinomonadaceae bacterium]
MKQQQRKVYKSALAAILLGLIICSPSTSLGWGAGGHMMVAQIAFKRMNPRARAKANELLAIPINPAAVTAQSKNFVASAHWADDLRPFAEFDSFKELHFIDSPFSTGGTTLPVLPTPNIVTALQENVNILKTSTDKNAQAQALRLIIHFVGDIHQPLHCATRVDSSNPEGDRGGNIVSIMVRGTDGKLQKSNLHSYWDGGIGSFPPTGANFRPPPLSQISAAVARTLPGNPATNPDLKLDDPFNFDSWANESFELAKDVAYKGMKNGTKPSTVYKNRATRVVRQRVAWGGYRLAALLNDIWP